MPDTIHPTIDATETIASVTQAQEEPEEEEERDVADVEIEGESVAKSEEADDSEGAQG